jgi:hypothetical protein
MVEKGLVAINPRFNELIMSHRSAAAEEGVLDKTKMRYSEIFDVSRLRYYKLPKPNVVALLLFLCKRQNER